MTHPVVYGGARGNGIIGGTPQPPRIIRGPIAIPGTGVPGVMLQIEQNKDMRLDRQSSQRYRREWHRLNEPAPPPPPARRPASTEFLRNNQIATLGAAINPTGTAFVIPTAGAMAFYSDSIITVNVTDCSPIGSQRTAADQIHLRDCYHAALNAAYNSSPPGPLIQTIAFPLLGVNPLNFSPSVAASVALNAIRTWFNPGVLALTFPGNVALRRARFTNIYLILPRTATLRPELAEYELKTAFDLSVALLPAPPPPALPLATLNLQQAQAAIIGAGGLAPVIPVGGAIPRLQRTHRSGRLS